MTQNEIVILKKTKKSERQENIKPGIMTCEVRNDAIYMLLSTGSEYNLKPELVMQALYAYAGTDYDSSIIIYTALRHIWIHRREI